MRNLLILLSLLSTVSVKAQSEWQVLNYAPRLNIIVSSPDNTLFSAGVKGSVYRATNDTSWQHLYTGIEQEIFGLDFPTDNIGFICGGKGSVMRTTNKGDSWDSIDVPSFNNLSGIDFIDSQTGWVVGDSSIVYKTTNSGLTWQLQTSPSVQKLNTIKLLNTNVGWIGGDSGVILYTSNGGNNWVNQTTSTNQPITFIEIFSASIAYAGGGYSTFLLKTTNGGTAWQQTGSFSGNFFIKGLSFINELTGWVYKQFGSVFKTTNGGNNWQSLPISGNSPINCMHFSDSVIGFATTDNSKIIKTSNSGANWLSVKNDISPLSPNDIYFLNENNFLISGGYYVVKTTNGGTSFQQTLFDPNGISAMNFINPSTGWACISHGVVYKTTNSGNNWNVVSGLGGSLYQFKSIFFYNQNTGWGAGLNSVGKTVNGGVNWQINEIPHGYDIYFTNSTFGWTSAVGVIYKTIDGGASWQQRGTAAGVHHYAVHFVDNIVGFLAGSGGSIMKTTNGGNNWQPLNSPTIGKLYDVEFLNFQTGWVVGERGIILKTTNGGDIWKFSPAPVFENLTTVKFYNENIITVGGDNGVIIISSNGGATFIAESNSQNINSFKLYQNYPNPFNPSTKINFEVPHSIQKSITLKLSIFDIVGKKIKKITFTDVKPGIYEYEWNAVSNPSGVYFYRIEGQNFSITKKMLLIK